MGVLKVRMGDAWEDVSGVTTNEVYVGPDDPRQGVYRNAIFWIDTTPPAGKDGPDAIPQGAFGGVLKVWNNGQWDTGDYVSRLGDTMATGATLNFPSATGPKIYAYGTTFGVGVESGELSLFGSSKVGFRANASNGTYLGYVDASTGGGLIIDRDASDARYQAKMAASTTHTVTWASGWSGTCEYRVSPTMVTCAMEGVGFNADTSDAVRLKMMGYPSGVPAPWKRLWVAVNFDSGATAAWYNPALVEFNTDGVWLDVYDNRRFGSGEMFYCSMSWAR